MKNRKLLKKAALYLAMALAAMAFFTVYCIQELDFSLLENRSHVVYDAKGQILGYTLSQDTDSYRFYTTSDEVSPLYLKMLLANEDHRFYDHFGVDLLSLPRALFYNLAQGRRTSGGSTLAMQVVKRLTGHERTYFNKLKEIIQASYITLRYGREEVLNWYLTLAPFGSNIEGVKAASLRWFGHLPNVLTPSEAALLTALPRAPEHIRPDRNVKASLYYKNEVLRLSFEKNVISKDLWNASVKDNLPHKLLPIKQNEQTFAQYLINRDKRKEIYTTINSDIEQLLQDEGEAFRVLHNDGAVLSIVVLDAKSHELVGILGSSDLKLSQICLPFAKRSPGSALKPFAYGLAFQEGKIFPGTILHDENKVFGSWVPQNFSKTFSGKVSAEKALITSLNLPALEVLNMIGTENFLTVINKGKNRVITKNNGVDPSVILGSGSIELYDLAELYAMLNEDGLLKEYSYLNCSQKNNKSLKGSTNGDVCNVRDVKSKEIRMLSQESARAVFEILKKTARPLSAKNMKNVSYKTGTSSRFTDALAIGSDGSYTVAVAIRFPNNKTGYHHYSGYADVAPILFSIFQRIKPSDYPKEHIESPLLSGVLPPAFQESLNRTSLLGKDELKIEFPSNGDAVMPDYEGRVFIRYKGGKGKVYLNYQGVQTEDNFFVPEKEGAYTISILDEYGHSDTVKINVFIGK